MESKQLHAVFFPFMAQGHMIPLVDMARLFARRGAKSTIVTTPLNAPLFSDKIKRETQQGLQIQTHVIDFPFLEAGLPEGCENVTSLKSPAMIFQFFLSMHVFKQPIEELLKLWKPDCIVADVVFHWATESAHRLGIPRLFFNGTGSFSMCLIDCFKRYDPCKGVESDSEPVVLPGLPHKIEFKKSQLPPFWKGEKVDDKIEELRHLIDKSEEESFGAVVNSFHELEPGYSEHYREVIGRKAWFVGPLSVCNKDTTLDKADRGDAAAIDGRQCLRWLDGRVPNSVLYICFGSISGLPDAQLLEIAAALEASGQSFIWVVKKGAKGISTEEEKEEWLPKGFEERMEGKGLIIRGWAPQVLILDHLATGGFMTHCGWNSTLEGVAAGVPMVTWPLQAEQFLNEKLVTDVLRVGVGVGSQEWSRGEWKTVVGREDIERAVRQVMVGEHAEEMRERAMELKEKAVKANEEGGSSYTDLKSLLEELASVREKKDVDFSSLKL
uniref:Glycosyltransferase n=1 Tax=Linum usitatissimum TaxID=4006 RepID=I2BH50_LINUS|nr:UDP-glycosyltransferase 1 [Linum usitatissimum]